MRTLGALAAVLLAVAAAQALTTVSIGPLPQATALGEGFALIAGGDGRLVQLDLSTLTVTSSAALGNNLTDIALGGGLAIVTSFGSTVFPDHRVFLVDPATLAVAQVISLAGRPYAVAATAQVAIVAARDVPEGGDPLILIDLAERQIAGTISLPQPPADIALWGETLLALDQSTGSLLFIDLATRAVTGRLAVGQEPQALATGGDRALVARSGNILVVDLPRQQVTAALAASDAPHSLALTPDGALGLISVPGSFAQPGNLVSVVNLSTLEVLPLRVGEGPTGLAASATVALVANFLDGTVSVLPLAPGG